MQTAWWCGTAQESGGQRTGPCSPPQRTNFPALVESGLPPSRRPGKRGAGLCPGHKDESCGQRGLGKEAGARHTDNFFEAWNSWAAKSPLLCYGHFITSHEEHFRPGPHLTPQVPSGRWDSGRGQEEPGPVHLTNSAYSFLLQLDGSPSVLHM